VALGFEYSRLENTRHGELASATVNAYSKRVRACLWLGIITPTPTSYPIHIDVGVRPERVAIAPVGREGPFHRRVGEYIPALHFQRQQHMQCRTRRPGQPQHSSDTRIRARGTAGRKCLKVGPGQAGYA